MPHLRLNPLSASPRGSPGLFWAKRKFPGGPQDFFGPKGSSPEVPRIFGGQKEVPRCSPRLFWAKRKFPGPAKGFFGRKVCSPQLPKAFFGEMEVPESVSRQNGKKMYLPHSKAERQCRRDVRGGPHDHRFQQGFSHISEKKTYPDIFILSATGITSYVLYHSPEPPHSHVIRSHILETQTRRLLA